MILSVLAAFFPVYSNADASVPYVIEVDIGISPDHYEKLTTNSEKVVYQAYVSSGDLNYRKVGINIRGTSSRELGLLTEAKRIPFEITQNRDLLFGNTLSNKSVKFISSFTLYRLIAEYLALELFSDFDIPTPEHAFSFVQFNGVDFGLYLAIEDINSQFLAKHYGPGISSAYKATNNEDKADEYIDSVWFGHLFEKVSKGSKNLSKLFQALDAGQGYEQYIDLDEWLRYFACVAATGGDGSIFTQLNNFVLYDNAGKFELIPWDLSEAFGGQAGPNSINRYYIWNNAGNPNLLFDLIMKDPENRSAYYAYIRQITEEFLAPERLRSKYEAILEVLAPYLPRDHSIYLNNPDALTQLRSEQADSLLDLWHALNGFYNNLCSQLDGKADAFFVNEAYKNIAIRETLESILDQVEVYSPMYDPSLPAQIREAYDGWRAEHEVTAGKEPSRFAALYCGAPVIVIILLVIFYTHNKKKKSLYDTNT